MPDNQSENPNSYEYNPNRPQNNINANNNSKDEHADTKKVIDTAAKGAAEYFAPGVGSMAYDAAKKVPIAGDTIDSATDAVAKMADQVPGTKKITKGLNDSGITDAADQAIGYIGNKGTSGATSGMNAAKKIEPAKKTDAPVMPVRKNNDFNARIRNNLELDDSSLGHANESLLQEEDLSSSSLPINDSDSELSNYNLNDENFPSYNNNDDKVSSTGDITGQIFKKVWDKYKVPIILGGGGLLILFMILIVIFGGASGEAQTMGYVDSMCNFNETKVTVTNCYQSEDEKKSLATYNLDELVNRLAYAYTNGNNYSDNAIQAMMIALKTNILSYGNYNSSDKEVEVRICDVFSNYNNIPIDSDDELWMLDSTSDELSNIEELYEEISNYLYISSSYRSTISNLSRQNILDFNANILQQFEELANSGSTYSQILNSIYNSDEDNDESEKENTVYKETLFLGDSRTREMQNAGVINSNNTIYGIGYGYDWLVGNGSFLTSNTNATNGGINGINNLMRNNANYNIVIWLGVNDLGNATIYYNKYFDLATGDWRNHNIYIVSVGPVDDDLSIVAKNSVIENFNNTMSNLINSSGLDNLFYIDLGYTEESINSYDSEGIHYSSSDYVNIYNIIMSKLNNDLNADYQLYNLTSYCTYYNLTENDAYWWPVGSSEATQGNIYGGNPVSTNITSTFGGRYHPVTGEWQNAHGAIDIGVSEGTPVIATKSGEITFINKGCSVGDSSCGGGYGNYIKIDHGDGIESLYAHLKEVLVNVGEKVSQGQIIGYSGNTGRSTGPHLHFEIRLNGTRVDPLEYVDPENPRPVSGVLTGGDIMIVGDTGDYSDYDHNKSVVCNSLLASGFSTNAVVGIMANMETESAHTYNPAVVEYGSGYTIDTIYDAPSTVAAGLGIIQWSYGRRIALINYAKERNWEATTLQAQLNYMYYEITSNNSYSVTSKYITGNYSGHDTAVAFCKNFERPGGSTTDLSVSDSCTYRANSNVPDMTLYVTNGCSD